MVYIARYSQESTGNGQWGVLSPHIPQVLLATILSASTHDLCNTPAVTTNPAHPNTLLYMSTPSLQTTWAQIITNPICPCDKGHKSLVGEWPWLLCQPDISPDTTTVKDRIMGRLAWAESTKPHRAAWPSSACPTASPAILDGLPYLQVTLGTAIWRNRVC